MILQNYFSISRALKINWIKTPEILYSKGCNINDNDRSGFEEAIAAAKSADVVILSLGEAANMSGEAKSRSNLQLPGVQEELMKEIYIKQVSLLY